MEMRTSEHSKPKIALVCDLISHSLISYQASELHQKRGRPKIWAAFALKHEHLPRMLSTGRNVPGKALHIWRANHRSRWILACL